MVLCGIVAGEIYIPFGVRELTQFGIFDIALAPSDVFAMDHTFNIEWSILHYDRINIAVLQYYWQCLNRGECCC